MKNPGSFHEIPEPPVSAGADTRFPRAGRPPHALTSPQPSQEGLEERPTRSPRGCAGRVRRPPRRCQGAAQKFTARPGRACRPRSRAPASPSPTARLRRSPRPRSRRREERTPPRGPRRERGPAPLHPPATRSSTLPALGLRGTARWGEEPPTGSRAAPRALTCAAPSTGVAGCPSRKVSAAPAARREGVRPLACPRSHLPPSRESPRAGPRARQCARAALSATAGGGGAAGGGRGARGGAGRRPAARPPPCPGAAAAPRARHGGEGPPGRPLARREAPGGAAPLPRLEPSSFLWGPEGLGNALWPRERARPGTGRHDPDTCLEGSKSQALGDLKPSVWTRAPS